MVGKKRTTKKMFVSASHANEHLRRLCGFGVKYAGTPGEKLARDYILGRLKSFGLDSFLEEFKYLSYMPEKGKLEILTPLQETLVCEPLQYTANSSVEGELLYVGSGSKEDFEVLKAQGVDFRGKVVMASALSPFWPYPIAENRGAVGFIWLTDSPENLIRAGTATDDAPARKGTIPGVAVSQRDGHHLLALMSTRKVTVFLESLGRYTFQNSWNVVGDVNGSSQPEKRIVVCSHYDSQIKGQHAWDNSSGCAANLELARVMGTLKPQRTVRFIFFGVEELGLFQGSRSYVKTHRDELKDCCAIVNTDGFSSALCSLNFLDTTPELREYALTIAKEQSWTVHYSGDPIPVSDHVPFVEIGIPTIWVHEGFIDPYYHTERDVVEHVNPEKLARITSVAGSCAFNLAQIDTLPF